MTFEEWVCENLIDKDFDHNKILKITEQWGIEYIKNAWDYQQERIDKLEHKLALRDAFIAGMTYPKVVVTDDKGNGAGG
jgi:hypothetical protein